MTQVTIDLAPVERRDLKEMLEWRNDYRVWQYARQNDLIDEAHHEAWFERQSKDPTSRTYKVMCKTAGVTSFVGVTSLTSIDWANRRAEFSIYIGPAYHRKGLGNMALRVLLAHGFTNLGLNLIWGETFEGNHAGKMFEKVGMTKDGTRRAFYWKNGKFTDAHLYSITAEEWHARSTGPRPSSVDHHGAASDDGGQPAAVSGSPVPPPPPKRRRGRGLAAVIDAEVTGRGDAQDPGAGERAPGASSE